MKTIAKRLAAGVSAAALLISAVGSDAYKGLFTNTLTTAAASGSGKYAKPTGFDSLEKDTTVNDAAYNSGYGLHTNKTATAVGDDGRTFDVDLESWYVGENPVDVATVLDASGSMAWTVDTLNPLEVDIDEKLFAEHNNGNKDCDGDDDFDIEDLIAFQNENGGYLPQDVVDLILKTENTDDTNLGYDGYKYYVYEARSSVSEFVPLGYWDGGADPKNDESLIGYYPFSGDLKNKAPKAVADASGMLINHPESGASTYDTDKEAAETPQGVFAKGKKTENKETKEFDKGLDIVDSSSKGAVLVASPTTNNFSISFELTVDNSNKEDSNGKEYTEATILYLTDGEHYYRIFRGGKSSAARLKMSTNGNGSLLNANNAVNTEPKEWKFTFDFENKQLKIHTDTQKVEWVDKKSSDAGKYNNKADYTVSLADCPELDMENLKIYIGGDTTERTNQNAIYIKNLTINDITDGTETAVATYPLDTNENGFKNTVDTEKPAIFVEQAYKSGDGKTFGSTKLATYTLKPVFTSDDKALDLNETSKLGAVTLDAVPDISSEKGFTISMKIKKGKSGLNTVQRNIFYLGNKNTGLTEYYQFFRSKNVGGYLALSKGEQEDLNKGTDGKPTDEDKAYYQGGVNSVDTWYTNTLVFEPDKGDSNKFIVTPYIDGKKEYQEGSKTSNSIAKISVNKEDLVFLLGAMANTAGDEGTHFIDDLYIFNNALTETQVADYFGEKETCKGSTKDKTLYHAKTVDGEEIAQISESLAKNSKSEERRGWYYVNSHSTWADVDGCLASGKQYIGIKKDDGTSYYSPKDIVTKPSGMDPKLKQDIEENYEKYEDKLHADYEAPSTERSIRFYVDEQKHLRCFVWSGADSEKDNPRTFCSLVYEKRLNNDNVMQKTKYEELNDALNTFYSTLAEKSDLSNTAVVRFSTINAVDQNKTTTTDKNLKKLIMQDWTSWSDYYQEDMKNHSGEEDYEPSSGDYLKNLLIPEEGEKSTDTTNSMAREGIKEYPYVMTGGTYTWTGLKSFYDNMVDKTDKESGDKVYDIANDARDKYLIIFTDGRDNTAGSSDTKYCKNYSPKDHKANKDSELANAWAEQLKDEGYTIYCVMMATGSISDKIEATQGEYDRAKNFLLELAGRDTYSKESDEEKKEDLQNKLNAMLSSGTKPDDSGVVDLQKQIKEIENASENDASDRVIVVSSGDGTTVAGAFQQILNDIQKPRNDYSVQDYIDPRFDLVDKDEITYHLGANGKITATDKDGKNASVSTNAGWSNSTGAQVGDFIDDGADALGVIYTPQDSYMVNRKETTDPKSKDGYDWGDSYGTGYIYYDDEKDMYYLRWEDQVIPMETTTIDTEDKEHNNPRLDVWSATIRLKAKDDFIGGNNILTNGNEAGENLVYSEATIENIDRGENYKLYGFDKDKDLVDGKVPLRKKLEVLSGTNRKINAVDADGVSQAVYGDGMDIPSSGFPRVTVNVRLKKLDAKNLNDVIYMGEVVSPTMMLADLENDYMTGSYYLEYLERYAYRLYGYKAAQTPLLDLLNQWLKIDDENQLQKTFTIPYMYLPAPIYEDNNTLQTKPDSTGTNNVVQVKNSSGMGVKTVSDGSKKYVVADFTDLNLRDVTGFITYTWKRADDSKEDQQKVDGTEEYDITKEYVAKNTNQIKYNLELKFTPLHEKDLVDEHGKPLFTLEKEQFITEVDEIPDSEGESFFKVDTTEGSENYLEFVDDKDLTKWTFTNRSEYLKAMVKEQHTYTPYVVYDETKGKWQLKEVLKETPKTTDEDTYDWDKDYKPTVGDKQIVGDKLGDYTDTLDNVGFADNEGNTITNEKGEFKEGKSAENVYSLVANTTYTKDVVNGALALELVVDGKYLGVGSEIASKDKTYTFKATRYYDDPIDPLPYGGGTTKMNADSGETNTSTGKVGGKQYQLTFKVNEKSLPERPEANQSYKVWAYLSKVEVDDGTGNFVLIDKTSTDLYAGYTVSDALPIGTYVIDTDTNELSEEQFKIGKDGTTDLNFKYLKADNVASSYIYSRFPENVYKVSESAAATTKDGAYLIYNKGVDNSTKNIAKNKREKAADSEGGKQTLTFNFGTEDEPVTDRTGKVTDVLMGKKGTSVKEKIGTEEEEFNDYAKNRLGILLLSVDPNSLSISKTVNNPTGELDSKMESEFWQFTVTFKPTSDTVIADNTKEFEEKNGTDGSGFDLKWYRDGNLTDADEMSNGVTYPVDGGYPESIKFNVTKDRSGNIIDCTATIYLRHNEKVKIVGLQEGTWKVTEVKNDDLTYTPHNDAVAGLSGDEWHYVNNDTTDVADIAPGTEVQFINEMPYELPSAGGSGMTRYIMIGGILTAGSVLILVMQRDKKRSKVSA